MGMLFPAQGRSTVFGFGSIPGSPEEARAFLQRRVAFHVAMMFALWALLLVLMWAAGIASGPGTALSAVRPYTFWLHVGATAGLGALWAFVRRGERSVTTLNGVDAAGTQLQAIVLGLMLLDWEPALRPELTFLLGLTHLLVARAAIVPSTPLRTAALGAASSVPLLVATYWIYTHAKVPAIFAPAPSMVLFAASWVAVAVGSTSIVSRVIYGLQKQVQEAKRLGQYTLEERIGEGGMGAVYRARHALLRRPTAIKLLRPERGGDTALARFEREVQLTSRLTHPNTIAIYDFGRTPDGVFYYAMEFLDGIDLELLVRRDGPQPPGRVVRILEQAAGALAEAHAEGLIHRDVKPANILLCERGKQPDFVKVLDFGLVKDVSAKGDDAALSNARTLAGTPLYMSPEAIVSPESVDGRSDLYALGAVGYFLLTGSPVFTSSTIVEVCADHLHTPVLPPSVRAGRPVPEKLERLLLACLEKDPARRPESAGALLDALSACDDVPPWQAADARRWWAERAAGIRAGRDATAGGPAGGTLAVDFARREAVTAP